MVSPIDTALSGLSAATTRIGVAASNIANQNSTGTIVNGKVVNKPYIPQEVDQVSLSTGGVQAIVKDAGNPTTQVLNPDTGTLTEVPNVDSATQLVNTLTASYDYKANLKSLKVQDDLEKNLLNIIS